MAAHQALPSLGSSRQEHWSGLPLPSPMHESENWKWSRSVVSDSLQCHGLQPTRLLCPWDFPGKSTGVGCHYLLPPHADHPPKANSSLVHPRYGQAPVVEELYKALPKKMTAASNTEIFAGANIFCEWSIKGMKSDNRSPWAFSGQRHSEL